MEISEVRVRYIDDPNARLKAFCSITLDDVYVIRDLRIVDGTNGVFVAMPSRRVMAPCGKCRQKNHLRARFCNECGAKLVMPPVPKDADGNPKLHRDVAHPISADFREVIQQRVLEAYHAEVETAPAERPPATESKLRDKEQAAPVPEPEPEALSEYDSLIAGLGAGGNKREKQGDRRQQRGPRQGASTKPRSGPARGDTEDRPRRGDAEDRPRRGGQRSGEEAPRKPVSRAVEPEPIPEPAPEKTASEPDSSSEETASAFGIGVMGEVTHEGTSKKRGARARRDQAEPAPTVSVHDVEEKADVVVQEEKPAEQSKLDGDPVSPDATEKDSPGPDEKTCDGAAAFGAGLG